MRKSTIAILSLSAVVATVGFQKANVIEVSNGKYEAEGLVVTALGACSYDASAVRCWDMQGQPNESLTDRIDGYYRSSNGNDLTFKLKRKNRLLVLQAKSSNGVSMNLQGEMGGYNQTGQVYDNPNTTTLQWIFSPADSSATTGGVQATVYNTAQMKSMDVTFRQGEKAVFAGAKIEIGASQLVPGSNRKFSQAGNVPFNGQRGFGYMPPDRAGFGKLWNVSLGMEPGPSGTMVGVSQVLTKNGEAIQYVDKNGKVISPVKYLESIPKDASGQVVYNPNPSTKYVMARFDSANSNVQNAQSYVTNIDPAEIGKIRFVYNPPVVLRFTGFPLDPK